MLIVFGRPQLTPHPGIDVLSGTQVNGQVLGEVPGYIRYPCTLCFLLYLLLDPLQPGLKAYIMFRHASVRLSSQSFASRAVLAGHKRLASTKVVRFPYAHCEDHLLIWYEQTLKEALEEVIPAKQAQLKALVGVTPHLAT